MYEYVIIPATAKAAPSALRSAFRDNRNVAFLLAIFQLPTAAGGDMENLQNRATSLPTSPTRQLTGPRLPVSRGCFSKATSPSYTRASSRFVHHTSTFMVCMYIHQYVKSNALCRLPPRRYEIGRCQGLMSGWPHNGTADYERIPCHPTHLAGSKGRGSW